MRRLTLAICTLVLACDGRSPDAARSESATSTVPTGMTAGTITDTARIGGRKLELLASGSTCAVRFDGAMAGELPLAIKPSCYFVRKNGSPQTYSYPDVAVQSVLIVVGSPVSPDSRKRWNLAPDLVCGEETQGVLLTGGQVVVTRNVRRGGVACRDVGVDEKEFWAFAHDEKSDRVR